MKHKTVYVPAPKCNPNNNEEGVRNIGVIEAVVLEKLENVNILTDSELLKLKKKWCGEAWDASSDNEQEEYVESELGWVRDKNIPDKETYLNNLNLD